MRRALLVTALLVVMSACTRAPLRDRKAALRASAAPRYADTLPLDGLSRGLREQAAQLRQNATATPTLVFGERLIAADDYARALDALAGFVDTHVGPEAVAAEIDRRFDAMEPYGDRGWGKIFLTSYFEPEIPGARVKTEKYSEPILGRPADLVEVVLSQFDERFRDVGTMRGRIEKTPDGKLRLLPYPGRKEITNGVLAKKGLELAWVDPVDLFFMHIQGAGTVTFEDGTRLPLSYADQNGQKYEPIGKFLLDKIPKEQLSLATIEAFLRGVPLPVAREVLFKNPSYVFYAPREGGPVTAFGTPTVDGRTIASDPRYFPKGAFAYLAAEKPETPPVGLTPPEKYVAAPRFVFDQDVGGAIRGGGRVDLFWGSGEEAKRFAGWIKQEARLWYLVPKAEWLAELRDSFAAPTSPATPTSAAEPRP